MFERVVVSREEALSMFEENKFKVEIISDLPADAVISLYKVGPMVDLCHGPHVPNTGLLKAVGVTSMSRAFWRADVNREPLQVSLAARVWREEGIDALAPAWRAAATLVTEGPQRRRLATSCRRLALPHGAALPIPTAAIALPARHWCVFRAASICHHLP